MLVNHTLTNITQGVSQQHIEARDESYVSEMINCIPDMSRGIFRRNPLDTINTTTSAFTGNPNFFSYSFSRGANKYTLQINNNNQLRVINTETGVEELAPITNTYLSTTGNVYDDFACITVQDFTFIVNKTKAVAYDTTVDGAVGDETQSAIYWIKDITSIVTGTQTEGTTDSNETISNYEGHTYTLNGVSVTAKREYTWNATTSTFDLTTDLLKAEDIAAKLATDLGSNYASAGPFVYWVGTGAPTSWEWEDSVGSSVSFGFHSEVVDSSKLPAFINDGVVDYYDTTRAGTPNINIYVSGGTDDNIGYWLQYQKGIGWKESRKPGMTNTLKADTMPHVLVRDSNGDFSFGTYTSTFLETAAPSGPGLVDTDLGWKPRLYGDKDTAIDPIIIGSTLNDITFYQNRLVLLTSDGLIMSEVNLYGNFFPTSIRALIESDPIELTVGSENINNLRYLVEFSDKLFIFSDTAQFLVSSQEGALSTSTAVVNVSSNYNIDASTKPVAVGNSLYYLSTVGGSTNLYAYYQSGQVANKFISTNVTQHVPTYVAQNLFKVVGHSTLGYVVLAEYNSNTLFIYNGTTYGEEQIQSAIHKWQFPLPIVGINLSGDDNKLLLTLYDSTSTALYETSISLDTPSDFTNLTYSDDVNGTPTDYQSLIEFSQWNIKQEGVGNLRGRLQLKTIQYSIADNSYYDTIITNTDVALVTLDSVIKSGLWDDTGNWCDACPWLDGGYKFARTVSNDQTVTVVANPKTTKLEFTSSSTTPTKGFNLHTLNFEGFYYSRSRRY